MKIFLSGGDIPAGGHFVEMLFNKLMRGESASQIVAKEDELKVLRKLWEWGEENLPAEELNDKLLLGKDSEGQTAWHLAVEQRNIEVLQKLWEWGKEEL
jgi:hypothetical protein